jgi:hypothetical protein
MIQTGTEQALHNNTYIGNSERCGKCGAIIEISEKTLYWK